MNRYLAAVLALGLGLLAALPASADGWRRHHHHGSSVRLHFGAPLYYRPYYYGPPPVVYAPPPVVVYRAAPPPAVVYRSGPPATFYEQPVDAVPTSPVYTDSYGRQCREFQQTVTVGGVARPGFGTACLQPDGSWRIVP